jgi:hypothetical protein
MLMIYRSSNVLGAALLALLSTVSVANAQLNLVPNGDFETPAGASWTFAGGGAVDSYPASGGNPDGYGALDSAAGWGVFVSEVDPTNGLPLASLGLTAGDNYDFNFDMIDLGAGGALAGIKLEGWAGGAHVDNSGDVKFNATTSWDTYTANWTIPLTATSIKFVPLSVDGGNVGFDNVGVIVPIPEPTTIALAGLAGLAFVTMRRRTRCK